MSTVISRQMQPRLTALHLVLKVLGVEPEIETVDDRKRVQKAVYLAQRAGVDLGYRFGWYKLGPYSPKLTRDYYALAEALEIGEQATNAKLRPQEATKLRRVKGLFDVPQRVGLPSEDWLELLASIDYLKIVSKLSEVEANRVIQEQKPALHGFLAAGKRALKQFAL